MFAFALWDGRRQRLILARDRSGKKPLFYAFDGTQLTFASEIKAILACPWVERRMAVDHLPELLTFGYVPTPRTLYHGIVQVPPASYVVVDQDGLKGPFWYWRLTFSPASNGHGPSAPQAAQRARELLTEAVQRRLISDVPLGALLSGGLDSSIVVGLMSQLIREPVRTFTIGMADDPSFDERPYAEMAARHFKTDHTEFVVKADAVALMERLIWHHDQPYGDSSAIPTYLVSKLARQQVTVVLNGDGGDEVFAGYDRFLGALIAQRVPGWMAPMGRALTHCLPRQQGYYSVRRRLERFLENAAASPEERFCRLDYLLSVVQPQGVAAIRPDGLARARIATNKFQALLCSSRGIAAAASIATGQLHDLSARRPACEDGSPQYGQCAGNPLANARHRLGRVRSLPAVAPQDPSHSDEICLEAGLSRCIATSIAQP